MQKMVGGKHKTEWITISMDEFESMKSTIEILSDPEAMKELRQGEKERLQGKSRRFDEVKKELGI